MYDFLASFSCMAYACGLLVIIFHWHGGMPGLIMDLLSLLISWIAMVLWVLLFFFWLVLMFLWLWVELLVLGDLVGQTL